LNGHDGLHHGLLIHRSELLGEGFGVDSDSDRDRRIQALFAFSAPVWTLLCGTGMFYVLPALIARIGGEEGGREFKINEMDLASPRHD
jgi:hypothetical protein